MVLNKRCSSLATLGHRHIDGGAHATVLLRSVVLPLIALLATSCAHVTVTSDALLQEVRENQIAALDKYQGETIVVTGRVEATGLKNFEETVVEVTGGWYGGPRSGTSHSETHQRAFVSLKTETAKLGNVVCFFSDDNRADAAAAVVGEPISLRGAVYRVSRSRKSALVLMDSCKAAK